MHPIVATEQLSPNVTRLVVEAPRIARDPAARPVRHRPAGSGGGAHPADDRRHGPGRGHDHAHHPVHRQEHDRPGRAATGRRHHRRRGPARQPHRAHRDRPRRLRRRGRRDGRHPADRPGPPAARGAGHQHHRRSLARVGDPRAGAGALRRGHRLHRRRELRSAGLRHRRARGRPRRPAPTPSTRSARCR